MNDIYHYGVLGMKWGIRNDGSISPKTLNRMVNKDVKRYADAKMFYGKGAGTQRKLLKAELDKKKKTIKGYEESFNKKVENYDYSGSAKKAVVIRKTKDTANSARITAKQILGVTGRLSTAAAILIYHANKEKVDRFVISNFNKAVREVSKRF